MQAEWKEYREPIFVIGGRKTVFPTFGLSVSLIGVVGNGLLADFINSISKIASKALAVVTAFSSIGNLLEFVFCDLPDEKIYGRLTIAW